MATKNTLDAALKQIDADIESLQQMRAYLLRVTADDVPEAPKAKRGRKSKAKPGLPVSDEAHS